jgi:hypothetical protein
MQVATPDPEARWRAPLIAAAIVIVVSMVLLVIAYVKLAGDADDEAQASASIVAMTDAARAPGS